MKRDQLSEHEAIAFGRRLDSFAAGLTPGEQVLLTAILHDAEAAQHDDADHRTPGDIAVAIHRIHGTPPISRNPQPIPSGSERFSVPRQVPDDPTHTRTVSKE